MSIMSLENYYFEPETEVIAGEIVPPITKSHEFVTDFPSVVERYFSKHYYCKNDSIEECHTILHHSNRICLIGLDKSHVAVKKGIKSINFDVGGCDRSKNQVTGKGKRGGMMLQPTSAIAKVICHDGTDYKVVSGITGKLIEVNERLLTDATLIGRDGDGYVAVVLPKIDKAAAIVGALMTETQFMEKIEQKGQNESVE